MPFVRGFVFQVDLHHISIMWSGTYIVGPCKCSVFEAAIRPILGATINIFTFRFLILELGIVDKSKPLAIA
jgi:hypothetical protein